MTKSQSNNVVLTGASGFIGRFCCVCLERNGFDVIRVGRSSSDDVYCDLTRPESLLSLNSLPAYKAFVHLGAHVGLSGSTLEDMYLPNVVSTALIADLVRKKGAHLIFASTVIIAGLNSEEISYSSENNPDTPYAKSKELAEECLNASGVFSAILRIGGVYGFNGPRHLGLNHTIQEAIDGNSPVVFGTGSGKRNYIYVEDLSSIIVQVVQTRAAGSYLVSGHEDLSIVEMYQSVCDIFGLRSQTLFQPGHSSRSQIVVSSPPFVGQTSFMNGLASIKRLAKESS